MEAGSVGGGCVKEFMRPPLLFLYTSVDSGVEFICGIMAFRKIRCNFTVQIKQQRSYLSWLQCSRIPVYSGSETD
jgi:hypothetical protein